MICLCTGPAQHLVTSGTGSTIDYLYDLHDLYDLYDLDHDLSERVCKIKIAIIVVFWSLYTRALKKTSLVSRLCLETHFRGQTTWS